MVKAEALAEANKNTSQKLKKSMAKEIDGLMKKLESAQKTAAEAREVSAHLEGQVKVLEAQNMAILGRVGKK